MVYWIMKLLVIGAEGQLGSEVAALAEGRHAVTGVGREDCDITDLNSLREVVRGCLPDGIVNAAAYTDVDGCEANRLRAFRVNALGARNVAIAARECGAKLIHVSTDYVFSGEKGAPYHEFDEPHPINLYGQSKLLGEQLVKEQTSCFFIVRTSWLYGSHGKNFVNTMLRLAREKAELNVVDDQRGSPTYAKDLAAQISTLLDTDLFGTYHAAGHGECSWFEFALEIFRNAGHRVEDENTGKATVTIVSGQGSRRVSVRAVTTDDFPRPARRPRYSVLDNYMLRLESLDNMREWREALAAFFEGSCGTTEVER